MLAVLLTGLTLLLEYEQWAAGADTSAHQIRLGVGRDRFSQLFGLYLAASNLCGKHHIDNRETRDTRQLLYAHFLLELFITPAKACTEMFKVKIRCLNIDLSAWTSCIFIHRACLHSKRQNVMLQRRNKVCELFIKLALSINKRNVLKHKTGK